MDELLKIAWNAMELAYPWKSGTRVGCAIRGENGEIVTGFNIEGLWMTSVHAEVTAIMELIRKQTRGIEIALVAKTEFFTPCGACFDWLIQFCKPESPIHIQNKRGEINTFVLQELYPSYPKQ